MYSGEHPQTPARGWSAPSGLPLVGAARRDGAYTIPQNGPLPFWKGGLVKLWRDTLQTSCQRGRSPLDSPCGAARRDGRIHHPPSPLPGRGEISKALEGHPPDLLPEGAIPSGLPLCSGGHPQTPAIGAPSPSGLPLVGGWAHAVMGATPRLSSEHAQIFSSRRVLRSVSALTRSGSGCRLMLISECFIPPEPPPKSEPNTSDCSPMWSMM